MYNGDFFITGIQQIGVGTTSVYDSWKWFIKMFGVDIRVLEDDTVAERMLPYTGGHPRKRHAANHSAELLALVKQQVVILYGLEPVALKVSYIECLLAVRAGYYGAYLIPTLGCELVGAFHIAALNLGAEYAQVTYLNLEIYGFGLAL